MSNKKFIIKLTIKILCLITCLFVVSNISETAGVIISNYVALEQMNNSDTAFILMETYNNVVKSMGAGVMTLFTVGFIIWMGADTYKFIKIKEKIKNEKES
jgi:hypothetical protein